MRMSRFSLIAVLSLATCAIAAFARDVGTVIERGLGRLLELMPVLAGEPRLALEGYSDMVASGDPLPSALLHELRHEAGMKHRAAARHT